MGPQCSSLADFNDFFLGMLIDHILLLVSLFGPVPVFAGSLSSAL